MLKPERPTFSKPGSGDASKPTVKSKRAAEAAINVLREERSDRFATALAQANRKTGLFKGDPETGQLKK